MVRSRHMVAPRRWRLASPPCCSMACGGTRRRAPRRAAAAPGHQRRQRPPTAGRKPGGTIYVLTQAEQWNHIDPQRAYTGEDLAFFGAHDLSRPRRPTSSRPTTTRARPSFPTWRPTSARPRTRTAPTWSFTLRDGLTWQDGSRGHLRGHQVRRLANVREQRHQRGPDLRGRVPRHPGSHGRCGLGRRLPVAATTALYDRQAAGQDLYDKAVTCDGKTITFHLNSPHADFNYTTTLGFGRRSPKAADTGETYGTVAPYVMSQRPVQGRELHDRQRRQDVLVRNDNVDPRERPLPQGLPRQVGSRLRYRPEGHRPAADGRLRRRSPSRSSTARSSPRTSAIDLLRPETPTPHFEGRAISGFDPYSLYYWINVNKVTNVKIRQAMAVALDREAIRLNIGGALRRRLRRRRRSSRTSARTTPRPACGTTCFGKPIPDTGDPELAKQLIAESGEPAPDARVQLRRHARSTRRRPRSSLTRSAKAGITVTPAPLEPGKYYSIVFDPKKSGDFGTGGWGADWPNASHRHPAALHPEGWLGPVAARRPRLQRGGRRGQRRARSRRRRRLCGRRSTSSRPSRCGTSRRSSASARRSPARRSVRSTAGRPYGSWPYGEMYVTEVAIRGL